MINHFFDFMRSGTGVSYAVWYYPVLFLPLTLLFYQLLPREFRRYVLLAANLLFYVSFSGLLVIFPFLASGISFGAGLLMESISGNKEIKRKERTKKKKQVLAASIVLLLLILVIMKYADFVGLTIVRISQAFNGGFHWNLLELAVPVGISYFTLESIAYLTDVYREDIAAEHDFIKLLLFMTFFPKLLEGPISRYNEISDRLSEGEPVRANNLAEGYQRILWGLFKKLVIADHLAPAVDILFQNNIMDGSLSLAAAVLFTLQEYMDFSGTIDIVIGSGMTLGIHMHENFRQPFFAKNASDFWRRWHITLGTFFKDYIFYPVTLSKPVMKFTKKIRDRFGKYVGNLAAPALALFLVWLSNGLWHGPRWTYIFYGMYYFVLIELENIVEGPFLFLLEKLKLKETSVPVRVFRFVKLFFLVIIGEMFFRADTFSVGYEMFKQIFINFHLNVLTDNLGLLGMDFWDYWTVIIGLLVVIIISVLKEGGYPIRAALMSKPLVVRMLFWYACVFVIVLFGAYGNGYDAAGMIYAKF